MTDREAHKNTDALPARRKSQVVREKYGEDFYARIGKKGGATIKQKYGMTYFQEIGQRGGMATRRNQGSAFYARIGKRGASQRQSLLREGTPHQEES